MMKNNNDLFFTCSLIEYIGRECKLKRRDVVESLGRKTIERVYKYAGTLHCEPMEKIADDFIEMNHIPNGNFDNITSCRYEVPDYWTVGEVYARLIEDIAGNSIIGSLVAVYQSWIDDTISNYNSDFYYQPRDYIAECFKKKEIL